MNWIRYGLLPVLLLTAGNFAYQLLKIAPGHEADWMFAGAVSFHQALAIGLVVLFQHIDNSRKKKTD